MRVLSREEVTKLLDLAMQVTDETDYKFFVDYSGHVNLLSVRYKYKGETKFYKTMSIETDFETRAQQTRNTYKTIIGKLEGLLKTTKVNYIKRRRKNE